MFESFAPTPADTSRRKRFMATTGMSALFYAAVGGTVLVLAAPPVVSKDEDTLDVTFEHMLKKEAPPPPPPVDKPKPKPKPKPAVLAPTEIPLEKPAEADPGTALAQADIPDPSAAAEAPSAAPPPEAPPPPPPPPPKPKLKRDEPISLPEEAEPPDCSEGNPSPLYPDAARAAGILGKVFLKIVISESGEVTDVKALKGEPLLIEAALAAVKQWKCKPAMLDGKPIAVYKIQPFSFTSASVGG
jgi:protein TonB